MCRALLAALVDVDHLGKKKWHPYPYASILLFTHNAFGRSGSLIFAAQKKKKRAVMDSRTADSPGLHSGFPGDPNVAVEPSAAAAAPARHKRGDVLPAGPVVVWQSFRPQFLPAHQPALIHTFSVQKKKCKCLPLELFRGDCRSWQWQLNTAGVDGVFRN